MIWFSSGQYFSAWYLLKSKAVLAVVVSNVVAIGAVTIEAVVTIGALAVVALLGFNNNCSEKDIMIGTDVLLGGAGTGISCRDWFEFDVDADNFNFFVGGCFDVFVAVLARER